MTTLTLPRLIIAAPMSSSGKTTVMAGLLTALSSRGLRVAPFKVGPDYIDPTYHTLAAHRPASNLDTWLLPPQRVQTLFAYRTQKADIALIEGMMGLFDGHSSQDDTGSTAHVARLLEAPILLVLDASAMASSAAPLVRGFRDFDSRLRLAGVVLNRVGGEGHARWIRDVIERHVGIPVVGYLPNEPRLSLPERALGLIPTWEAGRWQDWSNAVHQVMQATMDIDQIMSLACSATPIVLADDAPAVQTGAHATIAVARDAAFNFLYEDNLDLLRAAGAELLFFSPLEDHALPQATQAIYLCGGFPERYASRLASNIALHRDIRRAFEARMPIYAECGGLMYLTETLVDSDGTAHRMVGLLPGQSVMTSQLTIGYRTVCARQQSWLWQKGEIIRGHEFHYSTWQGRPDTFPQVYELLQAENRLEGGQREQLIASYIHLHFWAYPELAARFVAAAGKSTPWNGKL